MGLKVLQKIFSYINLIVETSIWILAYLLLFLMVAFPMVLKLLYVKAVLFVCLLFVIIIKILNSKTIELHVSVLLWSLFLASVSLFFVFKGFIAGYPGALKQAQVFVLWTLVYTILISGISKNKFFYGFQKTLIFSSVLIGIYGSIFVLTELNIIASFINLNFFDEDKIGFGLYAGYLEINFMGLNSLPFLIPFTMATLITKRPIDASDHRLSRFWSWIALILGLGVLIASGRRALLLVTMLSPLIIYFFSFFQPNGIKQITRRNLYFLALVVVAVIMILLFYLDIYYGINLASIYTMFIEGFDFGSATNESASIRRDQFFALFNGWSESPLLGAGHGASAPGYIRDPEMPWAYELYYVALLYQVGIIGFLCYTAGIIWIFSMAIRIIKQGQAHGKIMMPLMVGMSCYLIANITNPYLVRFDGIWVIFLPIAVINHWLLYDNNSAHYRPNVMR